MDSDGSEVKFESQVPMRMDDSALLILGRVTATLKEQYQRVGSWFDLVPDNYKSVVRRLARENFPFFIKKFKNDPDRFLEEMSRNWLMKFFAFESLAQASGFTASSNGYVARDEHVDRAGIVCLTQNGSYVLIGPGSCGAGAAMKYARVPFRNNGFAEEEMYPAGVTLENDLSMGNPICTNKFLSSQLISVFTQQFEGEQGGTIPEVLQDFDSHTTRCFARINCETLGQ